MNISKVTIEDARQSLSLLPNIDTLLAGYVLAEGHRQEYSKNTRVVFTSVGTTRGQGIIRVVVAVFVVVVATLF